MGWAAQGRAGGSGQADQDRVHDFGCGGEGRGVGEGSDDDDRDVPVADHGMKGGLGRVPVGVVAESWLGDRPGGGCPQGVEVSPSALERVVRQVDDGAMGGVDGELAQWWPGLEGDARSGGVAECGADLGVGQQVAGGGRPRRDPTGWDFCRGSSRHSWPLPQPRPLVPRAVPSAARSRWRARRGARGR